MKIDRSNYEAYFLDFIEGNLNKEEQRELEIFLQFNQDLKEELSTFEIVPLEQGEEVFPKLKWKLKREEETGLAYVDYLVISEVEKVQTESEKVAFVELVNDDPNLLDELKYYEATKKHLDSKVVFPNKGDLLKKEPKIIYWIGTAAAAVLFFGLLNPSLFYQSSYNPHEVAVTNIFQNEKSPNNNLSTNARLNRDTTKKQVVGLNNENNNDAGKVKPLELKEKSSEPVLLAKGSSVKTSNNDPQEEDYSFDKHEQVEYVIANENESIEGKVMEEQLAKLGEGEAIMITDSMQLAHQILEQKSNEQNLGTLKDVAAKEVKEKVSKSKSFKEFLVDEFVELTGDKIKVKTEKDADGKNRLLALNIGSFSFSRKK